MLTCYRPVFRHITAGDILTISESTNNNGDTVVTDRSDTKLTVTTIATESSTGVGAGSFLSGTSSAASAKVAVKAHKYNKYSLSGAFDCFAEEVTRGTKESLVCSGRGACNEEFGMCICIEGFVGHACSIQATQY